MGPAGGTFALVTRVRESSGVVDCEIADADGRVELSHSRLLPLKTGGGVLKLLAVTWDGANDPLRCEFHAATDAGGSVTSESTTGDWRLNGLTRHSRRPLLAPSGQASWFGRRGGIWPDRE